MAHTPRPWEAREHPFGKDCWWVDTQDGDLQIANFGDLEANARLIAAAPDLLEALEIVAEDFAFPTATHANIVHHAIAKAKGDAP